MFCFDRTEAASDRQLGFDDLDIVPGLLQPCTANQARQATPHDDDRCHLDDPRFRGLADRRGRSHFWTIRFIQEAQKRFRHERFSQESTANPIQQFFELRRKHVAAGQDDLEIGLVFDQFRQKILGPGTGRMNDIDERQTDLGCVFAKERPCLRPVLGSPDLVIGTLEQPNHEPEQRLFVVDDESAFRSALGGAFLDGVSWIHGRPGSRE